MVQIADRKDEMALLERAVEDAMKGMGRTLFISGEMGIGKSALCDALSEIAGKRGFMVLRGWCYSEYLRPYLPVESALKPLGMSHIFQAMSPPKIEKLFLIAKSGILLSSVGKEDGMDGDIFTGMLTAVGHFVRDSMQMLGDENGSLDVLGYGGMRILIEKGNLCSIAAVISGKENEYLLDDLQSALNEIHERYGDVLEEWDSDMDKLSGIEEMLQSIMESGKYEGIDYAVDDPKLIKGNIMENITRGLIRHSRESPILLIIEDLQWADSSTLSLIHYLSRNIRNQRMLIVGTYRTEDAGENLNRTMAQMREEGLLETLSLGPMDAGELAGYLRERIGDRMELREIVGRIVEESGGNPLFATEMLNAALRGEVPSGGIGTPRRIREILVGKMERLSQEERDVLEASAVLGEDFLPSTIARMLGMKRINAIRALKSLEKIGVMQKSDGKYRFRTPKFREILYEEMGSDLAGAYHELAAEALEEEGGSPEALGYHYLMAGIYDKAIPKLLSSAEEAMRKYSNEEAERQLMHVLKATEGGGWREERARALEYLGEIYMRVGRYTDAIERLEERLSISEEGKARIMGKISEAYQHMGDYDKAMETVQKAMEYAESGEKGMLLMLKGGILYRKGEYSEAMEALERALSLMEESGDSKDISATLRSIGNIYFARGEYEKAMEFYEKTLSFAEEDLSGRAMALNNMGVVNVKLGNYEKAAEYFEEALKIRERIGDQWGIAMFLSNLGVVSSESGDYDRAMEYFQRSLDIRERIGDRWGEAMSLNNIGLVHLEKGNYRTAIGFFEKALEIRKAIGDRDGMAASLTTLGMAYTEIGDIEKAMDVYGEAMEIEEKLGDMGGMAEILSGIGRAYALSGEHGKALEYLEKSTEICRETEDRRMVAYNLCCMMEIKAEKGYGDISLDELESLVNSLNSRELRAWYMRIKGILEHIHGNREKALDYMEKSLKAFEDMGREGDIGKTLYWMGLVRGEKESVEMRRALEIFEKLGMKIWENRVKEFMGV